MSTESDKGSESESREGEKVPRDSNRSKGLYKNNVVISSDDEETRKDFAPQEL